MKNHKIFIAWIDHNRRSQLIAKKFQMPLYLVHALKRFYFLAPLRYVLQTMRTVSILMHERPDVVFVQNPPIFAALVVYMYAKLFGAKFVIDSHTGALIAPWWKWTLPLHAFLSRRALFTLVTNAHLEDLVKAWGANTFILADIPTTFPQGTAYPVNGKFSLAVINTFSPDEPVEEVLAAAADLPDVDFYITGNLIRAKKSYLQEHPDNVTFTGFIPDDVYFGLLRSVEAIVVLTKDNHTMQRGACEAVSLGKPIITSKWPILESYFNKGTIHVTNTAEGIREGVRAMQAEKQSLQEAILTLQQERRLEWEQKWLELNQRIDHGSARVEMQKPGWREGVASLAFIASVALILRWFFNRVMMSR
ncbi:MAG: hypothetical protein KDJ52_04890 [Anaerolineae bacterium]|nr:hypothetical protein [Anaerolineae bacterium]